MSRVLAVDENNDLYLGPDGRLALTDGLTAVLQAVQQAAQTQLAEMIYAVDQGVPNFETVWGGAPNLPQFEAYLRRAISGVEGVTGVQDLSTSVSRNRISYRAVIQTIYGAGGVNG
jgi:hypothetical protein